MNAIEQPIADANEPPSAFHHPISASRRCAIPDTFGSKLTVPPNVETLLQGLTPLPMPEQDIA